MNYMYKALGMHCQAHARPASSEIGKQRGESEPFKNRVEVRTLRARVRPHEDIAGMRVRVHKPRAERHVRKRLRAQHCAREHACQGSWLAQNRCCKAR